MNKVDRITPMTHSAKQRITAFVDPILVKRAKVRSALEGLTLSEVVERALDAYAPIINKTLDEELNLKFKKLPELGGLIKDEPINTLPVPKHTKLLAVHR